MLQNARVTAFIISELLRENQQGGRGVKLPPPRLELKSSYFLTVYVVFCVHKQNFIAQELNN